MRELYGIFSWGSPVGLGIFIFLSASAVAVLMRGLSHASEIEERKKRKDKGE
jgi:hypothetical protein